MPSKASGVITTVTNGMATRLATKPTSETCWKKTMLKGARPTVATACVCNPERTVRRSAGHQPGSAVSPCAADTGWEPTSSATAAKDSQNPACSNAHGSMTLTTTAAASKTSGNGQCTPHERSSASVTSMHSVRCAGTPQPASRA
jgi:hypothetical protein